jgi:hypothetical protein
MPGAKKDTARVVIETPYGYVARAVELGDFTVQWETFREDRDASPAFKGLPDDNCPCPHWGLVASGRLSLRYEDRTEAFDAGEVCYAPPGHVPIVTAGIELISFSPTDELHKVNAALAKKLSTPQASSQE